MHEEPQVFDLILAGGGLANGLLALRLRQRRPELRILVLEQGERLGGNHTWSFYGTDLSAAQLAWVMPLVEYRWPGYEVRFPGLQRRLPTSYQSLTSAHFHDVVTAALGESVRTGARIRAIQADGVVLDDGERIKAAGVIDGRGFTASPHLLLGYQKFTGQIVRLHEPHGLLHPVIMDAEVAQQDGYRFMYILPLAPDSLLIEDTRYSDDAGIDRRLDHKAIGDHARARGWRIAEHLREETGVLPIMLAGDVDAYLRTAGGIPRSGLRALLFHATTGYSFACAVRLAEHVCALEDLGTASLLREIDRHTRKHWREQAFYRLLNRMLFRASRPQERWRIMHRFHGLPAGLIERFYAGRTTLADKARILCGKPPVRVTAALRCLRAPGPENFQRSDDLDTGDANK